MQVNRILETCLYVDDLAAAESFYSQVLGLHLLAKNPERHLFFRCGTGVLLLFNPKETVHSDGAIPAHGSHGPGHIAFAVTASQLPPWRAHLERLEVSIESDVHWPSGGRSLYFRDPAGNSVELTTPQTWQMES